jgi:excisionase family DNA binding protein
MTYPTRQPPDGPVLPKPEDRADSNGSVGPTTRSIGRGLLRIDEAAEWLGLSKRKTYELVWRGEIPSVYIGRSRRIAVAALEHFVQHLGADPP